MMPYRFAVIGNPIKHSASPTIHQFFAQHTHIQLSYELILGDEIAFENQVTDFFVQSGKGLNVTLPFKQRALAMAQKNTPRAQLAGAANTLWLKDNQLWADNTDGIGLVRDLASYIKLQGKRIAILGAGGAARGIIQPLLEANPASLVLASRNLDKALEIKVIFPQIYCTELTHLGSDYDLIINATSAHFKGDALELPSDCLLQKPLCYDLSYKQSKTTPFLRYTKDFGCETVDGFGMLVEQAAEAFYVWNEIMPPREQITNLLRLLRG